MHVCKSWSTQKPFPVFDEDLRQGNDFLICAVLPDTVHRHADPRFLKQTHPQYIVSFSNHAFTMLCWFNHSCTVLIS